MKVPITNAATVGRARSRAGRLAIALAALAVAAGADAAGAEAAVALCPVRDAPPARHALSLSLGDRHVRLGIVDRDDLAPSHDCLMAPLDRTARVLWLGAVSWSDLADSRRLTLVRQGTDERITAVEFDQRPPPGAAARMLVPGTELLPAPAIRSFGVPGRVSVVKEAATVTLSCTRGDDVAGMVVETQGTPVAGGRTAMVVEAEGDPGFSLAAQAPSSEAEAPARFTSAGGRQTARIGLSTDQPVIAVRCPAVGGRLTLLRGAIVSDAGPVPEPAAAWVWNEEAWRTRPAQLIGWARRWSVATLFVAVTVADGEVRDQAALAAFVGGAAARDIAVVVVEGDPAMITTEGRDLAVARARALAAYQAAHPQARLAGLQYDIEPYVADGFAADASGAWRRWAEALAALAAAFGDRVDAVVPFWILESAGGAGALAAAAPVLRQLTIMAYRTEVAGIIAAAAPVLSWASARGLAATVALEAGALPPERRDVFLPAADGELHVHRLGDVAAVVLMDRRLPSTGAQVHRRAYAVHADPARLTFAGQPTRIADAVRALTRELSAWPAARRIAIHGLADTDLAGTDGPPGEEPSK